MLLRFYHKIHKIYYQGETKDPKKKRAPLVDIIWLSKDSFWWGQTTLDSGIDVGPTFINFGFFSRPYGNIREYIKVIQMVIYYIEHVYLRPYVYSFCQIFQAIRLFPALRLFWRLEYILQMLIKELFVSLEFWQV